jgi:thiol-disulfide isomerase/thioredoxin
MFPSQVVGSKIGAEDAMATLRTQLSHALLPLLLTALGTGAETAPAPATSPAPTAPAPAPSSPTAPATQAPAAPAAGAPAGLSDADIQAKIEAIGKQVESIPSDPFTHAFGKDVAPLVAALNEAIARSADKSSTATMHGRMEVALLLMLGCDSAGAHALLPALVADAKTADVKKEVMQLEFEMAQGEGDEGQMQKLIDLAQKSGADGETISAFKQALDDEQAMPVGKPFPAFALTDTAGKLHSPADYAGKVLIIDFWATWCGPCMQEMPHVQALYATYHPQGLEILGVSLDQERQKLEQVVAARKIAWPMVFDGQAWDGAFPRACRVTSIPHTFLIAKDGTLVGKEFRGDQLEDAVKRLLAAPGPAPAPTGK